MSEPAEAVALPFSPGPEERAKSRGKILAVDDEPNILRSYRRILGSAGFAVEAANSGQEARDRLGREAYDAVLSDVIMPGMDGVEVLRLAHERDPDLPVVLISGLQDLSTALRAIDHGVLRYLNKPFEPDKLVQVIEHAVRVHQQARLKREALAVCSAMPTLGGTSLSSTRAFERALGTVFMVFQPVVSMSQQRIVAYEALMRTRDPELSNPGAMLAAAEQLHRVTDLGRSIREKCASAAADLGSGQSMLVNLHPSELLDEALFEGSSPLAGIAKRVVLEITERARLEEVDDLQERTRRLRQLGFRLAVDDIGSGYAGLNSFAQLNPEVVKLDMALVRGIEREPTKRKVVGSLVELSKSLGVKVIGEGVETPAERDALVTLGCDLLQGYYFARPAPFFIAVEPSRFRERG